jgi:hypothetical protein
MLLTLAVQYFEPSAERFVYAAALRPVFQKQVSIFLSERRGHS